MKLLKLMPKLGLIISTFCFITTVQAAVPSWSFTPDTSFPPTASVSSTGSATVQYTVTNNSSKEHSLIIRSTPGVSQKQPCLLGPKGSASSTCTLTLTVTGSRLPASGIFGGPVLCQANPDGTPNPSQCYQPNKADSLAFRVLQSTPILSASSQNIALSIKDPSTNSALTGHPRQITITNNGDTPATGLFINFPSWPLGTTVDTSSVEACSNGATLAVGGSCTITITPGPNATTGTGDAACTTGIAPIPGVVSVTANNANQTKTSVAILGYGCIYQGGFLFSVDDDYSDYPKSVSIGGKVAATVDQIPPSPYPTGIFWDSSTGCTSGSFLNCYTTNADSESNGTNLQNGNTYLIYQTLTTTYSEPATSYAAGLCTGTISGYTDWYLPAICEMGYGANSGMINCGTSTAPTIQNMQSNLIDIGNTDIAKLTLGNPAGNYWSSTEYSQYSVWVQIFKLNGSSYQPSNVTKGGYTLGVRCSRALTH